VDRGAPVDWWPVPNTRKQKTPIAVNRIAMAEKPVYASQNFQQTTSESCLEQGRHAHPSRSFPD
jgi:hypothetical protein